MKYTIKKTHNAQEATAGSIGTRKSILSIAVATAISSSIAVNSHALSFESGELLVDWDTTLNYSAAWRTQDQDKAALADRGKGSGNENFDTGSIITNRVSVLSEVSLAYRDYGAFIRGSAFYDDAYFGQTDQHTDFAKETKDAHGKDLRLLDAFVYGNFDVADRNLNVRVGRQVVSWGESLFISGISSSMSPADATKSNVPGIEVKDLLLPVGQVFAQIDLTENLALSAYSQWEWAKTEVSEAGSFFSASDLLDEAGSSASMARKPNSEPSDSGQWGVAMNYYAENVGSGTEFGLYYLNYHEKTPTIAMSNFRTIPGFGDIPGAYELAYLENVKLIGGSFGTLVGETNVGGEITYRKGAVIAPQNGVVRSEMLDDREDTIQAQLSFTHSLGVTSFADDVILSGEVGYNRIVGADLTHGDESEGSGAAGLVTLSYNSVMPGVDMEVPISFRKNFKGQSKAGNFTNTGNNTDRASIGAKFRYQSDLEVAFNYSAYFGEYDDNKLTDRDYVSFNVKYSF